ncbi:transcriptional regulator [Nocardia beijingensis]|uniref:transcriptional regulator n=1 Tax=Nocardia beijingensis TaxID=95162 RepID=UPI000837603F|nr:transcriptional regulator [Nocardia beijingensis]
MPLTARDLLYGIQAELAPHDDDNRMVPLISVGEAPRAVFAAIAAEEQRITSSDWRSFHAMAARADDPHVRAFLDGLPPGERQALALLDALVAAAGPDQGMEPPRAGCQAYPAYVAWLALNAEPSAATAGIYANVAAFGRYCRVVADSMRTNYEFDDPACAFFDFFAADNHEYEQRALAAIQAGIDTGRLNPNDAHLYARLFQNYELMFWNTLADEFAG